MADAPATARPGTLITVAPAAGAVGHLLRTAIDAEQVGATRLHLPTDQPDLMLVLSALREQTELVLTCDSPVEGTEVISSDFVDVVVADGGDLPDLPAVVTEVARLVAAHPGGVSVHGRGWATLPALLAALAAGGHVLVAEPEIDATGPGGSGGRDLVALVARASGLARIAGRPPLPAPAARALLGLT